MKKIPRGFTLVELIVAIGLFAIIMTLATGAYLIIIAANRQAQATSTGIDGLSYAIEDMTRTIRTGTNYSCAGGDCVNGNGSFSLTSSAGQAVTYAFTAAGITKNGNAITDSVITINTTASKFYVVGTTPRDSLQPYVRIFISGTVSAGPGKTVPFQVETGAVMRGVDL